MNKNWDDVFGGAVSAVEIVDAYPLLSDRVLYLKTQYREMYGNDLPEHQEFERWADEIMEEAGVGKTCAKCGDTFRIWDNDTSQSGDAWDHPEMCWSCGFDE